MNQKAKAKFGSAKMVNKFGKWFLHIPISKEVPALTIDDVTNVVGVDLGINHLATTYDSKGKTNFYRGGVVKQKRGVFKAIRKSLQEKQTSSARHRLKQIGSRENRYMTDVNHQITKALTQKHPKGTVFVLEDLTGVRQATEKVRLKNRYVSVSWAFYQFKQLLCYKAKENGQSVILIDPKYTSQTCPKCGHREKANRDKKKHHFHCKRCHYQSNDDRILLSCLCGSERKLSKLIKELQLLSCLCGSEHFDIIYSDNKSLLSCLCGSEQSHHKMPVHNTLLSCLCGSEPCLLKFDEGV